MLVYVFLSVVVGTCWVLATKQPLTLFLVIMTRFSCGAPFPSPPSEHAVWAELILLFAPGLRTDQSEYGISLVTVIGSEMITSSNKSQRNARRLFLPPKNKEGELVAGKDHMWSPENEDNKPKSHPGGREAPNSDGHIKMLFWQASH